jgi:hypothetical protein
MRERIDRALWAALEPIDLNDDFPKEQAVQIDRPHEVRSAEEMRRLTPRLRALHLPLTDAEVLQLKDADQEARAAFTRRFRLRERLARWLEGEGAPRWVTYRARQGFYTTTFDRDARRHLFGGMGREPRDSTLVKDLKEAGRFDLSRLVLAGTVVFPPVPGAVEES